RLTVNMQKNIENCAENSSDERLNGIKLEQKDPDERSGEALLNSLSVANTEHDISNSTSSSNDIFNTKRTLNSTTTS
ncbi:8256_t:CDS:2, partial [Cetraspora pellucida]